MKKKLQKQGWKVACGVAALAVLLSQAGSILRAQEGEHAGRVSGRGDRHSPGWDRAMKLKGQPLPPKFPKIGVDVERVVLENGMVVYLQEDHRLPLLDAIALVRTGTYYEPPDELGTADLVDELLRTGGTKNYPPEQLEERLDFIAANLSVSMEAEQCSVSLNVPVKDAGEGLRILADVLRNPVFEESRLELGKRQAIFSLRASNESPAPMIRREFNRLLYTEAHPSGRTPTIERIRQISREDLVEFHNKYFHPSQIMLGLTGDFDKTEMLAKVRELWGDWPKAEVSLPPLPKVQPQPKPGVYYINKPVNQTSIRMGHWGINRDNPDRFAIDLMNDILGGSDFSSRMVERVRNNEGLAYSVGTAFPTGQRDISFFLAAAQTRTESTVKAIQSMLDEIKKMKASRLSRNEFDTAREMFLYSYVFRFAEPARALTALMRLEYEHLPQDYLEKEFQGYQSVTPESIEQAANKYIKPEELTIMIVGDYSKLKEDLSRLGQPQEIHPLQFNGSERQEQAPGGGLSSWPFLVGAGKVQ
ncbi:MAG: insulinase family protein [Acidobacteria bacterium]|nr:insulinase family protein [Acidobacteriota bacterium]